MEGLKIYLDEEVERGFVKLLWKPIVMVVAH